MQDGRPNGHGTFYNPDGSIVYEGELKDKLPNGKGKGYLNGKLRYEGFWQNGKLNGQGTLYYPDGSIYYEGIVMPNK